MQKSLPIVFLTTFVLALYGCGIGEDSDIIGTNGMDDPSAQAPGDAGAPDGTDGAGGEDTSGDGSTDTPDAIPDPAPDDYDPCAGKVCGDACQLCDPNDEDCVETNEIKACNEAGECVSDTGDLCDEVDPEPELITSVNVNELIIMQGNSNSFEVKFTIPFFNKNSFFSLS